MRGAGASASVSADSRFGNALGIEREHALLHRRIQRDPRSTAAGETASATPCPRSPLTANRSRRAPPRATRRNAQRRPVGAASSVAPRARGAAAEAREEAAGLRAVARVYLAVLAVQEGLLVARLDHHQDRWIAADDEHRRVGTTTAEQIISRMLSA